MNAKKSFLAMFFFIYSILNVLWLYIFEFELNHIVLFFMIMLINIGVAYNFAESLHLLIMNKIGLKNMDKLSYFPTVALLYVTCNDFSQDISSSLDKQKYPNYKVFVLDDSSDQKIKDLIDNTMFSIVRRCERRGFKAGAINNWLRLYGNEFDYFIVADSDSLLDEDFIEEMVKYAEHPNNKDTAIFQSKMVSWNTSNEFARLISIYKPVSNDIGFRLSNQRSVVLSGGHNNLHRTQLIKDIGYFDERFASEDYATSLKLIRKGLNCKIVDVLSYDMTPENIKTYINRDVRWAKQNLETMIKNSSNLSFSIKFYLFMEYYRYSVGCIYLSLLILSIFYYRISIDSLIIGTQNLTVLLLVLFYCLYYLLLKPILARKYNISLPDFFMNTALTALVSYYEIFPLILEHYKTITNNKRSFNVTDKKRSQAKILEQIITEFMYPNALILLLILKFIFNSLRCQLFF